MKILFIFILSSVLLVLSHEVVGQRFQATGIVGANLAQIDGDSLFGFNKMGASIGARLSYANEKIWDVSLEMLFSQRGASDRFPNRGKLINTNYLEVPVVLSIRDWYIESEKFYKVRADLGLTYGVLFNPSTEIFDVANFNGNDFSWLIGAGINFTKRFGMSLRYTSSFVNLYKNGESPIDLQSYFLTLRSEFNF